MLLQHPTAVSFKSILQFQIVQKYYFLMGSLKKN